MMIGQLKQANFQSGISEGLGYIRNISYIRRIRNLRQFSLVTKVLCGLCTGWKVIVERWSTMCYTGEVILRDS